MALRSSQTDLMREKEKAQRERARMKEQSQEKNLPFPRFPPPRKITEQDDRIEQILGTHPTNFNLRDTNLLGVISQPPTPSPANHRKEFFPGHKKPEHVPINGRRPNLSLPNLHTKPTSADHLRTSDGDHGKREKPSNADKHANSEVNNYAEKSLPKSTTPTSIQIKKETISIQTYKEKDGNNKKDKDLNSIHVKKENGTSASSKPKPSLSKSPISSTVNHESSQVKPSPKPSPEKPIPLGNSKISPPNGINRPLKKNLEKLRIPSGQNEEPQSVDEMIKEMTSLELPLTAISTPKAPVQEHFPFPNKSSVVRNLSDFISNPSKPSQRHSSSGEEDLLNISLLKPIEPLITPPETPVKPPNLAPVKTEKSDDVSEDLNYSESEDEDEETNKIPEGPPRKDQQKGKRAPVKEPRTSMSSDDSSDSESQNESDSSSDESNSSSDDDEEESCKVKVEKSPEHDKSSGSVSWRLDNFIPGDKGNKSTSSTGSDNTDNNDLMNSLVDKLCKSKSPIKSPYQPLQSPSNNGEFRKRSPRSTPSKSLVNGITPSKRSLHSDSDSEIDVVNTPQKKVSISSSQKDQNVAKCLNFPDSKKGPSPKRQVSELSIIGSLSSDDEDEDNSGPHNNNDSDLLNIQNILEHVGTKHVPVSPLRQEEEKSPPKSPLKNVRCVRTPVNKDALKYNDGKPSIVVSLSLKNVGHLLKDRIKKSPYRDKVGNKCEDVKQKSPYPNLPNSSLGTVHKSPFHDKTANTEPVEMDLDTDSEMVNGHIEDYSSKSVSLLPLPNEKCWKSCDSVGSKRKENYEPSKVFKKRKVTPRNSKSTDTAQKERDSHEDDHKWDRKHPPRSSETRNPLSNSSSSSSHTDKPEFELVEDLNGQTNSDAHPSSVETIYNREGDGEIPHDPITRKPIRKPEDPLESSDVYRQRARDLKHQADELSKRLKHQIDTFSDRISMYLLYTESIASFILCACAMEKEDEKPANIYRMYSDTLNLISHIIRIRINSETTETEKKLAVLVYRIQSILSYRLYRLKKTEALKFKKIIDDHNKTTSSKPAHAPSPHWNNRSTPSPISPSPSPAGSVGSQGSTDFTPSKMMNGGLPNQPTMSSPSGTVAVPQRIHSITQQYLSIVSFSVQCHEYWDQAENVYQDLKDFYDDINEQCGSLSVHSSVPELVYYIQTGLQKIRDTT